MRECAGIFVPEPDDTTWNTWAFNAWQSGGFAANCLDKCVSMRVKTQRRKTLSALSCMNGLAFFHSNDVEHVTFA